MEILFAVFAGSACVSLFAVARRLAEILAALRSIIAALDRMNGQIFYARMDGRYGIATDFPEQKGRTQ